MLWPPHALSNTRYKIIFQLSDIYILPVLKPTVTEAVSRREEIIFVAQAAFLPIVDVEDGRTGMPTSSSVSSTYYMAI